MAAERRNDGSTDVSLQKRKLEDHGSWSGFMVLGVADLRIGGQMQAGLHFISLHFTSLHFLKAPKTGQRTPAALSDSKTGP